MTIGYTALSQVIDTMENLYDTIENEYYTTKVYRKYEIRGICGVMTFKYVKDTYSYHFKKNRNALITEGRMIGITKINRKTMKEIADCMMEVKKNRLIFHIVKMMDEIYNLDRECIKKIIKIAK